MLLSKNRFKQLRFQFMIQLPTFPLLNVFLNNTVLGIHLVICVHRVLNYNNT